MGFGRVCTCIFDIYFCKPNSFFFFHQNEVKAKGLAAQFKVTLEEAQPTLGHMSLVQLCKTGLLQLVVSTNVDGIRRIESVQLIGWGDTYICDFFFFLF